MIVFLPSRLSGDLPLSLKIAIVLVCAVAAAFGTYMIGYVLSL